jgi:drug/metabolite transporter (DMT)-like permease
VEYDRRLEEGGRGVNQAAQYRLGLVLISGSAIAWSTAGYFTRLIAPDNWTILLWRGIFAAIGVLIVMLAMDGKKAFGQFTALGTPGWLFAAISGAGMVVYITSLTLTTVAHVAIIYGVVPFVAAGLSWLVIGEKPTRIAIGASAVALAGVIVMVGIGTREGSLFGDFLAFLMTLAMAAMMVISRRHRDMPILAAACLSAVLSAAACWPWAMHALPTTSQLVELALMGLVNSAVGISLFTLGSRMLPAVETGLIGSLDAPLAPVWVWLAFGETPGTNTILGGILVFGAVMANVALGTRSRNAVLATQSGMD